MFGARYFGARYFGGRYFGKEGLTVPGYYNGARFFGNSYFGRRYFGTPATSIPFELVTTNTPAFSGALLSSGNVSFGVDFELAVLAGISLAGAVSTQGALSFEGEDWSFTPPLEVSAVNGALLVAGDLTFTLGAVVAGSYFGGAYFGGSYFGKHYWGTKQAFSLATTAAIGLSGVVQVGGDIVSSVGVSPTGPLVLAGVVGVGGDLLYSSLNYTSASVLYVPVRMVSGLWSSNGVDPTIPPEQEAWLPPQRQSFGYVDPRDGKIYCDPMWYRAFEFLFETRLGGRGAPSLPDVITTVTQTQTSAAAASATVAAVQQQTQANAEALFVVREVVQENALTGANQIPTVEL